MLLALRLVNFKSIKESPQIEFGKLNILSGTNSSGKSTLIQSILLSAQTLLSDNHDQALVLNGPLVSLGTPSDLWYNGQLSEPLGIRFTLRAAGQGVDVLYDLTFEAAQESETPTIQLQEGYYATSLLDAADYSGIRYIR
ncbi:MAG: AAA family ATPase, partial [Anaerolineae bacterium]|nr:AAA family ATPase [Anaerolineae bacterium]